MLVFILIRLQAQGPATFLERDSNTDVFPVKFPEYFRKKYLWTSASVFSLAILFTMHEKDTVNEAYLEPSRINMMEFFMKTFNGL